MKSNNILQATTGTALTGILPVAIWLMALCSYPAQAQKKTFALNVRSNPLASHSLPSGRESHPFFIDIDGDNDLDCFSGEYTNGETSGIYFYRNDGTDKHPVYKMITGQANPLSDVQTNKLSIPYLIDIDNDGDYDCFIGEGATGAILYYKNTGTATKPEFKKQSAAFNPLSLVKLSASGVANPAFADIDGDGDVDCLVADEAGYLNYFKNTGTRREPLFEHVTDAGNPFAAFAELRGVYNVSFEDWNKDGLPDLFINATYFENKGTKQRAWFAPSDTDEPEVVKTILHPYSYTPLRWVDLNNDGTAELMQGSEKGGFTYQTVASVKNAPLKLPVANTVQVSPNPSKSDFLVKITSRTATASTLQVINVQGKIVVSKVTSDVTVKLGKDLTPGIYMLQVIQNNKVIFSQKLVKE